MLNWSWRRAEHLIAFAAAQDVGDMRGAEPLPDARHARENLARQHDRLGDGLQLVEAVVAGAAVGLRVGLAEISNQMAMAATDARRVPLDIASSERRASVSSPLRSSMTRHFKKSAVE